MPVVVDASAVVELLGGTTRGATVADAIGATVAVSPATMDVEVLSALVGLRRGGKLAAGDLPAALDRLATADITRAPVAPLIAAAARLTDDLSAYDAVHVALAQVLGCGLITADARLAGAPGLGIPVTVLT